MLSPFLLITSLIAPNSRQIDRYKPFNYSLKCEYNKVYFATFYIYYIIRNIVSLKCLIFKATRRGAISNFAPNSIASLDSE
jgi:hypothetical protein